MQPATYLRTFHVAHKEKSLTTPILIVSQIQKGLEIRLGHSALLQLIEKVWSGSLGPPVCSSISELDQWGNRNNR